MTIFAHAAIAHRIDAQPTERLPRVPSDVASELTWSTINGKPEIAGPGEFQCDRHHWCTGHASDIDGTTDHWGQVTRWTVPVDAYTDRNGQTLTEAELGVQATAVHSPSGEPMDDYTVSVWLLGTAALLTAEQALEIGCHIANVGAAVKVSAEKNRRASTTVAVPAPAAAPALRRRRSVGAWLWQLWEYRPTVTTVRRRRVELDETHIDGVLAGRRFERSGR